MAATMLLLTTVVDRLPRRSSRVRDLARAEWALLVARAATWLVPSGRLFAPDDARPAGPVPRGLALSRRLASDIDRASALGPIRGTCLVRAVALQRLMRASGLQGSRIRFGVKPGQPGQIAAHAWVEYGNARLGRDGATADAFLPFANGGPEPAGRPL